MSEYVPGASVYRHRCLLDACTWVHDEPACGPFRVDRDPATGELDISGAINRQVAERNRKIEDLVRAHLATHTVDEWAQEINDMRAKIAQYEATERGGQVVDGIRPHAHRHAHASERMRATMAANPPLYPYGLDR